MKHLILAQVVYTLLQNTPATPWLYDIRFVVADNGKIYVEQLRRHIDRCGIKTDAWFEIDVFQARDELRQVIRKLNDDGDTQRVKELITPALGNEDQLK